MATGKANVPLTGYHFYLELDGIAEAQFREVGGLDSESNIIEYKSAGKNGQTIIAKVPGELKWSNITLKRGVTNDMKLWEWRKKIEDGDYAKNLKNGSIVLYDQGNKEVARWNFEGGWPSKVTGPQLNANNNDIAIEEVTIAHHGLKRIK